MTQPRHPKPKRVRPNVGISKANAGKKLTISEGYLAAQGANDPTNKLGAQATTLRTARTNLVALLSTQTQLRAQVDANDAAVVVGFATHDQATTDYATAAAVLAAGDASALAVYGVTPAAEPTRGHVVDMPVLGVGPGKVQGDAHFKCPAVPYAGAYVFEYKLEPSQPTDPWLPQGGIMTTYVQTTVSGLAPEQQVRGRVRAVGGTPGPWSLEVVGRAK